MSQRFPKPTARPAAPSLSRSAVNGHAAWTPPDVSRFVEPFNDRALIRYYRALFDWHGYIRFLGLPHLKDHRDVPIPQLYVGQHLSAEEIHPDRSPDTWPATQTALDALAENPRLVVLGDPGSGKSTLVSWLAWGLSRPEDNALTRRLGPLVPLPFVLRELKLGSEVTWEGLVGAFLAHPVGQPLGSAEKVEELLASGQALVLLDGLDEIGTVQVRQKLRDVLHATFERYPSARWLVTSRLVGYDEVPFEYPADDLPDDLPTAAKASVRERFGNSCAGEVKVPGDLHLIDLNAEEWVVVSRPREVMTVQYAAPFRDEQIEQFAKLWYARREAAEAVRQEEVRDFIAAVRGHEHTLRLARVPILLTLMALIHRVTAKLPHGRARLYGKIAEAYLESIDGYRKLPGPAHSLERKREWLGYVAFRMQCRRGESKEEQTSAILVTGEELRTWLVESMERSGVDNSEAEAREFVDYVGRRSGLLLPRAEGRFAFTHLSFQEFFAACYLQEEVTGPLWMVSGPYAEGASPDDLRRYANDSRWRETLILLFELLAEKRNWSDALAARLFDTAFERLEADQNGELEEAARLLAELSVDPYAGLSKAVRAQASAVCWRWELRHQQWLGSDLWSYQPRVAQTLTSGAGEDAAAWLALAEAAREHEQPVTRLILDGCVGVTDLGPLSLLNSLQALSLDGCVGVTDLGPLSHLMALKQLYLSGCVGVTDLGPLSSLTALRTLILDGCVGVRKVGPLSPLTLLKQLYLSGCVGVTDLGPLSPLMSLQALYLSGCVGVTDLGPLSPLTALRWLTLSGCVGITDLGPLSPLTALRDLSLSGCVGITDLGPLSPLTALKTLSLSGCTGVTELGPLSSLTTLTTLYLTACEGITEVGPLAKLEVLERLYLMGCTGVTELTSLSQLMALQGLYLNGCSGIKEVPEALRARPDLRIVGP